MAGFNFDFISARDGRRLRTAVFQPEKPRRSAFGTTIVLLSGQSEFIEKYLEVVCELNARGFTVATFDWRGQGGSSRALSDGRKGYVGDFAEYDDDLVSFMDQVAAKLTDRPPLVMAHSMGGHLALRALHDHPEMFGAAVLLAPMLAISARGYPPALARAMTALQTYSGHGSALVWGMEKRDPLLQTFATQLCTQDPARFERTKAILQDYPELRLTGPTWGWIEAAYRSMKITAAPDYGATIKVPVLLFGAGADRIVMTEAIRKLAPSLINGHYHEIDGAEHEILMERDAIRAQFWAAFDAFTQPD